MQVKCLHWHGQTSPAAVVQPCLLDISQIQLPHDPSHTPQLWHLVGLRQVEPIWVPGREWHLFWKVFAALFHANLLGHMLRPLDQGHKLPNRVSEAGAEWGW